MNPIDVICPYCGQANTIVPDIAGDADALSTDCAVCCRPMIVQIRRETGGAFTAWAEPEHGG